MGGSSAARRILLGMRRRPTLDFSDYLELRRLRDGGERDADIDGLLLHLEAMLPVAFARAIPHLVTLDDAEGAPPRGLDREHLRVAFAIREEFARHGDARTSLMMGIDLPERPGLPDWLDLVEGERKHARAARQALRDIDARIWAIYTGVRRMPTAAPPAWKAAPSRILHQ